MGNKIIYMGDYPKVGKPRLLLPDRLPCQIILSFSKRLRAAEKKKLTEARRARQRRADEWLKFWLYLEREIRMAEDREHKRAVLYERTKELYESDKPYQSPSPDGIAKSFDRNLERCITQANERYARDEWEALKERRSLVRAFKKGTEQFLDGMHSKYRDEIWYRKSWEPLKWMLSHPEIARMLKRTKFAEVYNWLWQNTLPLKACKELMERHGIPTVEEVVKSGKREGRREERHYVLVKPTFSTMARKLGMSERNVNRYLRGFSKVGVLKDLGKLGPNEQKVYAIGIWLGYETDQFRRNPFLKNTREIRQALPKFKL